VSASENLSPNQFRTVYRGIKEHPDKIYQDGIGIHWTDNMEIAKKFGGADYEPSPTGHGDEPHGTILEAKVHDKDIVHPYTKQWYDMGGVDDPDDDSSVDYEERIFPPDHEEAETTLKYGTRVNVTKLHHFEMGKKVGEVPPKPGDYIV